MKTHLSDILLRLSVVIAVIMTMLAALIQPVPASAEPSQGDRYWSDSFADPNATNGSSASTHISVSGGDVRLALQNVSSVAFNDSFEVDLTKWILTNTEWTLSTDNKYDGAYSARARATTFFGTSTHTLTSIDIDLTNSTSAYLDFWYRRSLPSGGNCRIYYFDGTNWNLITTISGTDTNWINFNQSIPLPTYQRGNFKIRFEATLTYGFSGRDTFWIDKVSVNKTVQQYYSSGSINSVSITPSNLQSWGQFNASASTLCWPYRKAINITGTNTLLTDYQINVSVTYVPGKMNANFSDLRFKDGSGNELNYWIESYNASTSAQVWVKIPTINASGTTAIYMYYGNPLASSTSNGSGTFIFFDDFSGGLSKWNPHRVYGTYAINSSVGNPSPCLELGGGIQSGNYGFTAVGTDLTYNAFQNGIIEADIYPYTDSIPEIIFRGVNTSNTGYKGRWDGRNNSVNESPFMIAPYSGWPAFGTIMPHFGLANQWQKVKLVINGSTFSIYSNGTLKSTVTNTSYAGPGEIGFANHFGVFARLDNIRVRNYASPEPAINSGSEENSCYTITYKILNAANDSVLCTITAAQAAAGYDISSFTSGISSIKLRAEFSTSNISQTPILYDWRVTWTSVIQDWIDIQAPTNISSWDLYPGTTNTNIGTLNVTVSSLSVNWSVTANDSDTVTNGRMTLWNESAYNTLVKLTNPMNISAGSYNITLPSGDTIIATGPGNVSQTITFKQDVTWDDEPGIYRIVVTFTGRIYP